MEWINLQKGTKYILEPRGMRSKELLAALTEAVVELIEEPSIPPDPGDFAYKVQIIGEWPKDLASQIWVPGEWLHPYRELETKQLVCACPHLVVMNRGCQCGVQKPYRSPR